MIALLIFGAWWALLALVAWALCRSSAQADARSEAWAAERESARDALEAMGARADAVVMDFRPARRHR